MTHEDFLKEIRKAYLRARKVKEKSVHNRIVRCTSHSISSLAEDLFAKYCADLLAPGSMEILVDPQISFKISGLRNNSGKRSLLFRPDVCFLKNNEVVKIFDIKTDLGYKRSEIINQVSNLSDLLQKIKGVKCTVNMESEIRTIVISKKIECYIVVVSGAENSGDIGQTQKTILEQHKIDMLVLSGGDHLNTYKTEANCVPTKDFNRLDRIIRS